MNNDSPYGLIEDRNTIMNRQYIILKGTSRGDSGGSGGGIKTNDRDSPNEIIEDLAEHSRVTMLKGSDRLDSI